MHWKISLNTQTVATVFLCVKKVKLNSLCTVYTLFMRFQPGGTVW